MAGHGPVPKRSEARRRRNKESVPQLVEPVVGRVAVPRASASWHPLARAWFRSLEKSGQSRFFEPSDWQAARYVAEVMSRNLNEETFSASLFRALWSAMSDLMTTEAQRRRLRMEVDRQLASPATQPAGVTALVDYKKSLDG